MDLPLSPLTIQFGLGPKNRTETPKFGKIPSCQIYYLPVNDIKLFLKVCFIPKIGQNPLSLLLKLVRSSSGQMLLAFSAVTYSLPGVNGNPCSLPVTEEKTHQIHPLQLFFWIAVPFNSFLTLLFGPGVLLKYIDSRRTPVEHSQKRSVP